MSWLMAGSWPTIRMTNLELADLVLVLRATLFVQVHEAEDRGRHLEDEQE